MIRRFVRFIKNKQDSSELVEKFEEMRGVDYLTLNGSAHDVLWGLDDPIMKVLYSLKLAPSPQLTLQVVQLSEPRFLP